MFRQNITWKEILKQPTDWYKSPEARKIAATVLLYQHPNGGWEKNLEMTAPPKSPPLETTIDNGATTTQIVFLARVGTPELQAAALKRRAIELFIIQITSSNCLSVFRMQYATRPAACHSGHRSY